VRLAVGREQSARGPAIGTAARGSRADAGVVWSSVGFASQAISNGSKLGALQFWQTPGRCPAWGALLWLAVGNVLRPDGPTGSWRRAGALALASLHAERDSQFLRGRRRSRPCRSLEFGGAKSRRCLPWCRRVGGPDPWRPQSRQCTTGSGAAVTDQEESSEDRSWGSPPPKRPPCALSSSQPQSCRQRRI